MDIGARNRLSVENRKYRYLSSKNPYFLNFSLYPGLIYANNKTEDFSGKWKETFQEKAVFLPLKLHVEIGCNAGHVLVPWAKSHPNDAYIGIDWKYKPIFRAAQKASKESLKNLILLRAHAERCFYIFSLKEIDFLYLYFPDPWEKKSQKKNRFITTKRLIELAKIMKPKGIFHIKTDHREYFECMIRAFEEVSAFWEILELSYDLYKTHPSPESLVVPDVTVFEKLFIKKKIPIQTLKIQRL